MKPRVGIAAAGLVLGCFTFTMPSVAATSLQMATGGITNGTVELEVGWPASFTNNLEIFTCTNLMVQGWKMVSSSLSTTGATSLVWVDTDRCPRETAFQDRSLDA